jgi:2-polyprenyl-3-methyl-5-hydroxy-6-metoxy-1,4-benzoquinol methylase
MDEEEQVRAYSMADFEEPHSRFVTLFRERFPDETGSAAVLDLGCGAADIAIRFARTYPLARLTALDGAQTMLRFAQHAVAAAGLQERIGLIHQYLPASSWSQSYQVIISNSLLHHLADAATLWTTIREAAAPGAAVFVMDLLRPQSVEAARVMVAQYSADEPPILQRDFYHSLLAAYSLDEVRDQLIAAGLGAFSLEVVSDRHWIASGRMAAAKTR